MWGWCTSQCKISIRKCAMRPSISVANPVMLFFCHVKGQNTRHLHTEEDSACFATATDFCWREEMGLDPFLAWDSEEEKQLIWIWDVVQKLRCFLVFSMLGLQLSLSQARFHANAIVFPSILCPKRCTVLPLINKMGNEWCLRLKDKVGISRMKSLDICSDLPLSEL